MTEESQFRYLDREDIRSLHAELAAAAARGGEPIPDFGFARQDGIDALIAAPQQRFFGRDAYPTLAEKAAIIFYTVNKQQLFVNGNKRMSTLCLLVFLDFNHKRLEVDPDELTAKALWLANSASLEFPQIKADLVTWIDEHLADWSQQKAA